MTVNAIRIAEEILRNSENKKSVLSSGFRNSPSVQAVPCRHEAAAYDQRLLCSSICIGCISDGCSCSKRLPAVAQSASTVPHGPFCFHIWYRYVLPVLIREALFICGHAWHPVRPTDRAPSASYLFSASTSNMYVPEVDFSSGNAWYLVMYVLQTELRAYASYSFADSTSNIIYVHGVYFSSENAWYLELYVLQTELRAVRTHTYIVITTYYSTDFKD